MQNIIDLLGTPEQKIKYELSSKEFGIHIIDDKSILCIESTFEPEYEIIKNYNNFDLLVDRTNYKHFETISQLPVNYICTPYYELKFKLHKKLLLGDKSDNVPGITGMGPIKLVKLFSELTSNHKVTLESIIEKSAELIDENKLYLSVVERRHQLYINQKIMSLDGSFLSPDNKQLVKQAFNDSYELNIPLFLQLYSNDKLGESIPNVQSWLSQLFGYPNSFK
jgi:5'-3' exonuclease